MERFRSPAVEKRARGIGDLCVVVHGDVVHVPCRKVDTAQLRMRGSIGIAVWLCDGDDAALMKIRGMVESPNRGCRYAGDDSSRLFAAQRATDVLHFADVVEHAPIFGFRIHAAMRGNKFAALCHSAYGDAFGI